MALKLSDKFLRRSAEAKVSNAIKDKYHLNEDYHNLDDFDDSQQIIVAAVCIDGYVGNGGFHYYLYSDVGNEFSKMKTLFSIAGADRMVDILYRVESAWPGQNIPEDREERIRIIDDVFNENGEKSPDKEKFWNDLQEEFYDEKGGLYIAIEKYYKSIGYNPKGVDD